MTFAEVSVTFDIPLKNIIRWVRQGVDHMPRARRCLNPLLEDRLYREITDRVESRVPVYTDWTQQRAL